MKKSKWLLPVLLLAVLVLELLPFGAVLRFASPEESASVRKTFSYFSLTPFGYANFGPLLTALLTAALVAATLVRLLRGKGGSALRALSVLALLTSLLPLLLGISYYSVIGGCITALLCAISVLCFFLKNEKEGNG